MVTVSKEESMLLIQHAISAYLNEGKNQKELGALLGIDGSRISEGKIGKWKLSLSQRQVIIDNYGYPRRGKGQYIKAEVYDTVTEFINDYEVSSKRRLKRRLYELLMRKDYQDLIISYSKYKDEISFDIGSKSEPLVRDISIIEKLLSQPEAKTWYDSKKNLAYGHSRFKKDNCDDNFEQLLNNLGIISLRNPMSKWHDFQEMMYRIAQFKFELMPEFSFNNQDVVHSVELKQLVITGDKVLSLKGGCLNTGVNDAADIFGPRESLYNFISYDPHYKQRIALYTGINCKPDHWYKVELKLYLSESMRYHLWIRLCGDSQNHSEEVADLYRDIVIKDLCRINYLKEIETIRKWCGLPCDFNDAIKREVAKVGGYVPGAEVL
ncbi:hypothetical protein [Moritella sp.]|uniref:hypothetical protein n=1 Tax=Moritella sp. TaxID=78556 RepID=UPI0025F662C4|nr:hypothetical protein [Moritella sp.]MCJ8352011.1 hypothetical protein [Moritella sp.]